MGSLTRHSSGRPDTPLLVPQSKRNAKPQKKMQSVPQTNLTDVQDALNIISATVFVASSALTSEPDQPLCANACAMLHENVYMPLQRQVEAIQAYVRQSHVPHLVRSRRHRKAGVRR